MPAGNLDLGTSVLATQAPQAGLLDTTWTTSAWLASHELTAAAVARALHGAAQPEDELAATRALSALTEEELAGRLEPLSNALAHVLHPELQQLLICQATDRINGEVGERVLVPLHVERLEEVVDGGDDGGEGARHGQQRAAER